MKRTIATPKYIELLSVKVTKVKDIYIATLYYKGKLYDQLCCTCKQDIGWTCREMMRWSSRNMLTGEPINLDSIPKEEEFEHMSAEVTYKYE